MKAYISGKISGLPMGVVIEKFEQAEKYLLSKGFEVVNPVKLDHAGNIKQDWAEYMKVDIKAMMECDTIALLPCWLESPGARVEFGIALTLNYSVISMEGMV